MCEIGTGRAFQSRCMRRTLSRMLCLTLLLCAVHTEANISRNSERGTYHLMSRRVEGHVVSSFEVIERFHGAGLEIGPSERVAWDELGLDFLWPLDRLRDADGERRVPILVTKGSFPDVRVEFTAERVEAPSSRQGCQEWELRVEGSQLASEKQESQTGVEGVTIKGIGRALLCEGDTIPSAFRLRLERTCDMAPWFSPNGETELEFAEIAWVRLY